jgi:hypothetical protein
MYRICNDFVFFCLIGTFEYWFDTFWQAIPAGHETTGYDKTHTSTGTLPIEGGHALMAVRYIFQPGMHGTHQYTIFQCGETKV